MFQNVSGKGFSSKVGMVLNRLKVSGVESDRLAEWADFKVEFVNISRAYTKSLGRSGQNGGLKPTEVALAK